MQLAPIECERLTSGIQLWHAALDRDQDVLDRLRATLSQEEKARADRFHFERDRNHFVVARGLLRELLGMYLHKSPTDLRFSYGRYGKPSLSLTDSSLSFNLSHSSGVVAYAIARERNLGVDVELVRPNSDNEGIAERYFSIRERNDLHMLPPEARDEGFYNCWTRKEAYLKACGMGLRVRLDSFAVSLSPDCPAQFLEGVESFWHLASFHPAEGYAAAVVYDGVAHPTKCFSVDSYLRF